MKNRMILSAGDEFQLQIMRMSVQRSERKRDAHERSPTSATVQEEGQSGFGGRRETIATSKEDSGGKVETCCK